MTNYYEDEIKKYYRRLDEINKKKEELNAELKKLEQDQEFIRRQIKSIEGILEKEKKSELSEDKKPLVPEKEVKRSKSKMIKLPVECD